MVDHEWREAARNKGVRLFGEAQEDFVDFLSQRERDRQLARSATELSEAAFSEVWDNDADADYDGL